VDVQSAAGSDDVDEAVTRSWKLETGNWKLEAGSWKLEAGNWKLETGNWKLATLRELPVTSFQHQATRR
jgi:hypothetical protein